MRQVHEIVDHEPVVALDMDGSPVAGPSSILIPVQVRDQRRIGERRIARPEPDEAMPLLDRKGTHAGGRIDGLLRRHERAAAI